MGICRAEKVGMKFLDLSPQKSFAIFPPFPKKEANRAHDSLLSISILGTQVFTTALPSLKTSP